jgi:hypothetical protein
MEQETTDWRAVVRSAVEAVILLVILFVAGPIALAILDGVRLAFSARNLPNVIG